MERRLLVVRDRAHLAVGRINRQDLWEQSGSQCCIQERRVPGIVIQVSWDRNKARSVAAISRTVNHSEREKQICRTLMHAPTEITNKGPVDLDE